MGLSKPLGREPECDRVVDLHLSAVDFRTLCESFIASDEFNDRVRPVYTENLIRVDDVMESPKLSE